MATQQDLQELLRLLTVSRKVPMIQAMGQIKALQAVDLKRSVPYQIGSNSSCSPHQIASRKLQMPSWP